MGKFKIALPIIVFLYLFVGGFFFITTYSADEMSEPTVPTIVGFSYDQMTLDETPDLWVALYNPPINVVVNPDVGETVCSVETSLTFPKDLIEVQSVNFAVNDANNYSNDGGTINFRAILEPCTTRVVVDLFDVTFKTKQIGQGAIHFTKSVVTGGSDGTTALQSGVYSDVPVDIVPVDQYDSGSSADNPLPDVPADVPQPEVKTITKSATKSSTTSSAKSASSASASTKTAEKIENSAFKTPTLTKLEFDVNAVLDKSSKKSQGAVFTGTAEPNSKVYILIHSQSEIYTDTTSGADGTWSKTIEGWLEDGSHTVAVWSEKDNKISPKYNSQFVVSSYAKDQIAIGDTYPEVKGGQATDVGLKTTKESKLKNLMENKFFWAYIAGGLVLIIITIVLIVKSRRKKNNSNNNLTSDGTDGGVPLNMPSNLPPQKQINQEPTDTIYPNADIK